MALFQIEVMDSNGVLWFPVMLIIAEETLLA